ncbi:MAG: MBOAT family protein [Bacteroidales bacterium]|nr:MBOAT family protein [Bacteroidales bacterium]
MVFNSIDFLIFGILFFILWPFFNRKNNLRWSYLTVMSFIFYGWWDWRFIFLIIASGLIDFYCGLAIAKYEKRKKIFLILSLSGNLLSLSVFKYSAFFANIADDLFSRAGLVTHFAENLPGFTLILPVGISFYTFQSLSYTIDIYRGRLRPTHNILHFFSYLSMFPQLVAGPIIRAKDMLFQLAVQRKASWLQKWDGIKLIVFGLFQKVVLADNLSFFIDSAFEGKMLWTGSLYWWLVMTAFSFQIYCDFSGYSLIARGLAKFMGYHFKMNFNHPYLSSSMKEFWSRWHISLSTWFRDYVYIPLGGSRKGFYKGILFIWITMLLSGLWHGANYTFIIWGAVHAFLLSFERITKPAKRLGIKPGKLFIILFVFLVTTLAWVFFRADSMGQARDILIRLFSFEKSTAGFSDYYFNNLVFLVLAVLIELTIYFRRKYAHLFHYYKKHSLDVWMVAIAVVMIIFFRGEGKQFIYFQF